MLYLNKKVANALLALSAALSPALLAAQELNGLWQPAPATYAAVHGAPALQPAHYSAFTASESGLRAFLESSGKDYTSAGSIALPRPEGGYRAFRIWATPVMAEALAAKYPEITTYTAEAADNHSVTAKIDYSPLFGMHAMVYDGSRTYLIDPYSGRADGAYIAYYKSDYSRATGALMHCDNGEEEANAAPVAGGSNGSLINGTVRRKYRLALAADSEYCAAVAGLNPTKAAVLAKMVVSVNRVNGIYEREFALTMQLIANEDTLIFTGADPYSNNSGSSMLGQNQSTVTNRIGSANYDIGHVFSTGGGGIAYQACVCNSGNKAKGVTGSASPVGDAFDVDYVAHEMGHQYSADHTFNASTGSCNGNGNLSTSYEPGSGSTIMAYANICGSPNDFQKYTDPYFHSASLEQISSYITIQGTCAATSISTNTNAALPGFSATYNIPYKTPFELTGPVATDATADTITYCWEQRNTGGVDFLKTLAATTTDGPLFRSFLPTTSTTRSFPNPKRLVLGPTASTPGEKLPDVTRSMSFGYVERDVYQGWGCFNFPTDRIILNAYAPTGTSDVFKVTLPAGGETWTGGSYQTITWDVAGTNGLPVLCTNVDILLSIDGGNTYPITLKANTSNDGSETVLIPSVTAYISGARIKVRSVGNVFFSINPANFALDLGLVGVRGASLNEASVQVSPVPAEGELRVSLPTAAGAVDARLLNTLGQAVWNGTLKGNSNIAVGSLPRGVYYLRVAADGGVVTKTVTLR